jgi:hypothetical protein
MQALQQLGWTDGRNMRIETRWGGLNASDTRKFADPGSMSGLPESGYGACIDTAPTSRSSHRRHSPAE